MSKLDSAAACRVRIVLLDADGVMTDGGLYFGGEDGAGEGRRFHVHDGIAVHMLRRASIPVAIVSGKISDPVRSRAEALGITTRTIRNKLSEYKVSEN